MSMNTQPQPYRTSQSSGNLRKHGKLFSLCAMFIATTLSFPASAQDATSASAWGTTPTLTQVATSASAQGTTPTLTQEATTASAQEATTASAWGAMPSSTVSLPDSSESVQSNIGQRFSSVVISLSDHSHPALHSQPAYQILPAIYDGSMMPYDFSACTPAEVPDSLTPFFISYVGRHGARFLSSEKKVTKLEEAISKAREAGNLTPLGEEMATLVDLVKKHTDGRWGALDSVGAYEQQRLAVQMADMWPSVTQEGTINATATYVPRVVMSMYEFTHSLCSLQPKLDIYTAEGHKFDPLLRYFTTDPAYVSYLKEKPWQKEYDSFIDGNVSPQPAINLFGSTFDEKENRKLTLDIYSVIQSLRAAGLPAPDSRWMSPEEYKNCWKAANLEHYFARTDNPLSSIPVEGATPLLSRLIDDLSSAASYANSQAPVSEKTYDSAILYFGHAETLMPLLSLCDVAGCNAPLAKPGNVDEYWKDYEVVPLGANFEITLLKAPSGNIYALTRLNGHDVKIGDLPSSIVPWQSLKDFWASRVQKFTTHTPAQ